MLAPENYTPSGFFDGLRGNKATITLKDAYAVGVFEGSDGMTFVLTNVTEYSQSDAGSQYYLRKTYSDGDIVSFKLSVEKKN